ncbi:MAG: RtcB family protein [Euryarchaeota archaeon]|nr:RtcB family protein [Euryarchaeota archaeon]
MRDWKGPLETVDEYRYRIPQGYKPGMRTCGIIYANARLIEGVKHDEAPEQVANVATLPGITGPSMAMPDIHWGYGFPIGGVAATDAEEGVLSPGGVGYDINCGVRLLRTNLRAEDVRPHIRNLIDTIFEEVPSGLGSKGKVRLDVSELDAVLEGGAAWAVGKGFGLEDDLDHIEENGRMEAADASKVSRLAKQRGAPQLGTLGAGNHFLEIQRVEEVYDDAAARALGMSGPGQVMVMVHTGSRGCGYQICDDWLKVMHQAYRKYRIDLPDPQLACAPAGSQEARDYFSAMACGANYAWANRQLITHWVREAFGKVLGQSSGELGLGTVYDLAHNIAKLEEHEVEGRRRRLYVHRKGATRAFGPDRPEVVPAFRALGQPVLIPGNMGSESFVLLGTRRAMDETFGSACHGAGRVMSRNQAVRQFMDRQVIASLGEMGIYARGASDTVMSEEAPGAYKDVASVVDVCHGAGIARKVARLRPMGVMKG